MGYVENDRKFDEREELRTLKEMGVQLVPIKLPSNIPVNPLYCILTAESGAAFDDLTRNRGMPSMVDTSAFKVGENLAVTPGAVVLRNELLELIQYTPATATVRRRPLLVTPPQINKYYALDLSPDKSMVRFLIESGIQTFAISWRNPTAAHRDWGLDTYVAALDEAVDATREISGSEDISMMGSCSGGITSAAYFATLGGATEKKIRNLVLAVCLLDPNSAEESAFGCLMTPETMRAAKESSRLRGIVDGHDLAHQLFKLAQRGRHLESPCSSSIPPAGRCPAEV